ncbi:uncharacterized protein LOC116406516 isoform X1 [Xenopus tropicalis]|uniref:Uncharacterized protein LOC116406516 isoform X1 n=1 Tax=Xenopus tropicalis TaxID=8364 RepID=A0A8J1JQK1_XENTR|nr:uncharacterized protein LOC116406516 isoform X1 [Xenopus tropicalis]
MPFPGATLGAEPHTDLSLLKREEDAVPVTGSPEAEAEILQVKIEKEEADSEGHSPDSLDHLNSIDHSFAPLSNGDSSVALMKISQTARRDFHLPRTKSSTVTLTDSYRLIELVEERPGLYMTESPAYHNKYTRRKLWDEVAANLIDRWENLTDQEKNLKAKEIQLKWKHIKDCYRREVTRQNNEGRNGSLQPKRKKYIYADMLTFLIPCFAKRPPSGNCEVNHEEDHLQGERSDTSSAHMSPTNVTPPRTQGRHGSAPRKKKKDGEITPGEVKDMFHTLVNTIAGREAAKTPHPHEHLPEFLFFRGLIPSVLMIPEGQRPLMQAEVVQVINKYIPHLRPTHPTAPRHYPQSYTSNFPHHI